MRTFLIALGCVSAMIAPAVAVAAINQMDSTVVGMQNGQPVIAHSLDRRIDVGRGMQKNQTFMHNGRLATYVPAPFGKFGGLVRTRTPNNIAALWHQSFG